METYRINGEAVEVDYPPHKYVPVYDREARGWNVIELLTGNIIGMFGGGKQGEQQARRSADNHNTQWLLDELNRLNQ